MGRDLYPAVIAIIRSGDEHLAADPRPPLLLRHSCGSHADPRLVCSCCGEELDPRKVAPEPAPGSASRVA
jgi:hypothetical protein